MNFPEILQRRPVRSGQGVRVPVAEEKWPIHGAQLQQSSFGKGLFDGQGLQNGTPSEQGLREGNERVSIFRGYSCEYFKSHAKNMKMWTVSAKNRNFDKNLLILRATIFCKNVGKGRLDPCSWSSILPCPSQLDYPTLGLEIRKISAEIYIC